jgi:hypothetical protein
MRALAFQFPYCGVNYEVSSQGDPIWQLSIKENGATVITLAPSVSDDPDSDVNENEGEMTTSYFYGDDTETDTSIDPADYENTEDGAKQLVRDLLDAYLG